ncbi:hypothetical protein [Stakelama tenebrarum]|uniref:Uncharacterized protein n=1 Tax=Stakelama tenebrarum TaxID=2711215 RepID=A0A6G6Y9J6_9SPHN|nr:hypothetical protein [Sphingosinithalassobacter tenebrarum]QIG81246.1 hypothetical protein G5C33_16650 [Sphingosinithalassobacter tenebrarum]
MSAGLLALLLLTMKLWPDVPVVQVMHRWLIAMPLEKLSQLSRKHLLFAVLIGVMALGGFEVIAVLGSADALALVAWDMSLYLDAVIAMWTASAIGRMRGFVSYMRLRLLAAIGRRPRTPRTRSHRQTVRAERGAANDDDADGAPVFAWAA